MSTRDRSHTAWGCSLGAVRSGGVWRALLVALGLLAGHAAPSASQTVEGSVQRVVDGDTLVFRPEDLSKPAIAVRLRGIDAPESCQAWGRQSTAALRAEVEGRPLSLRIHGHDEYRRTLGTLLSGSVDLNARLVEKGHAWAWRDAQGRSPYLAEEARARKAGAGLHASAKAQPPWDFRREYGRCAR